MHFAMDKRQKIMLLVFVLLLYVFALVKLVMIPVLPKINEIKREIQDLEEQKKQLDQQVTALDEKYRLLEEKENADERMGFYLLENGDITDSVYFIEKLARMMGTQLLDIHVKAPEQKKVEEIKYYAFETDFSARMHMAEAMELASFIDGSPLKAVVPSFSLKADDSKNTTEAGQVNVDMSVQFFAMDVGVIDKLYQSSMKKFMTYMEWLEPPSVKPIPEVDPSEGPSVDPAEDPAVSTEDGEDSSQPFTADIASSAVKEPDLKIHENSFLAAGDNVKIFSRKDSTKMLSFATKKYLDVALDVTSFGCYIQAAEREGKVYSMVVPVEANDFTLSLDIDFPLIKENENLGMHVKISNSNRGNVYILLANGRKGISICNSQGEQILVKDEQERIYIL